MSTSKMIYRDLTSDRLITRQQAASLDPETWQKEIFEPSKSLQDPITRRDLPSVLAEPERRLMAG